MNNNTCVSYMYKTSMHTKNKGNFFNPIVKSTFRSLELCSYLKSSKHSWSSIFDLLKNIVLVVGYVAFITKTNIALMNINCY